MKITNNLFPWQHLIVENYFDQTLFDNMVASIQRYDFNELEDDVTIFKNEIINGECCTSRNKGNTTAPEIVDNFPEIYECLTSNSNNLIDFLPRFIEHRPFENYKLLLTFTICKNGLIWPIHDEMVTKILSNTIYVYPEVGDGTLIYEEDQSFWKEVPWVPNTAMIFAGKKGSTWHSYQCTKSDFRFTVNQFIVSTPKE